MAKLRVPFVSIPVTILDHPKFSRSANTSTKARAGHPSTSCSYAAAHVPDGDFSSFTPHQWGHVFRLYLTPMPKRGSKAPNDSWGMSLAKRFKETGWFDDRWVLDPEIFQSYNGRLGE
jgi:hypothetical protein